MSAFDAYDYSKDRACKGKTVIWTGDDTGDRIAFQEGRILWHKKPAA